MRLLKLAFIPLLSMSINAQQHVQIDMHGGKNIKIPSHFTTQKPKGMQDMLHPDIKKKDSNQTMEQK